MVSHCFLVALRLRSPTCGGTRWYSAACRSPSETRWRFGAGSLGGGARWHLAAHGALNGTQWVRVARHARGGTRTRCSVAHWHSAVLGSSRCCARVGARARGNMHRDTRWRAVVLMSVGGIWRSAALGSTQRCTRARAVARWHESWHSATLCSARWSSAAAVERGGMRQVASRSDTARRRSAALCSARWRSAALGGALQRTVALSGTRWNAVAGGRRHRAVTPHGGARWRANVCTLWHSVTSGGARRPALACVAVSAHLKSAGWLLQRSSADQR